MDFQEKIMRNGILTQTQFFHHLNFYIICQKLRMLRAKLLEGSQILSTQIQNIFGVLVRHLCCPDFGGSPYHNILVVDSLFIRDFDDIHIIII